MHWLFATILCFSVALGLVLLMVANILPPWSVGLAIGGACLLLGVFLRPFTTSRGTLEPRVNTVMRRVMFIFMGVDGVALGIIAALPSPPIDLFGAFAVALFLVPAGIILVFPGVTRMGSR